jgi:hypothetical protein
VGSAEEEASDEATLVAVKMTGVAMQVAGATLGAAEEEAKAIKETGAAQRLAKATALAMPVVRSAIRSASVLH